jgi:hypothetical protein
VLLPVSHGDELSYKSSVIKWGFGSILVVTVVTVVVGAIFGLMEIRRARQVRSDNGARDVLSLVVSPGHSEAATEFSSCR